MGWQPLPAKMLRGNPSYSQYSKTYFYTFTYLASISGTGSHPHIFDLITYISKKCVGKIFKLAITFLENLKQTN